MDMTRCTKSTGCIKSTADALWLGCGSIVLPLAPFTEVLMGIEHRATDDDLVCRYDFQLDRRSYKPFPEMFIEESPRREERPECSDPPVAGDTRH
ncbi:hypothetical protein MCRY_21030 [Marivita cryptomonadis]|jgi:hypothetical protein|uniref:hypothetical protein n=1 Tax=Marivita cryptomonadis TaxID=505252 RepID=UPI000A1E235F|nr:hypothetical protein [Marivita cryptomonadis]OSQ54477.1 hypothetical protein MCRY_21030 [Marivita cryptomonadis]